jgi:hypothetical protein
MSPVQLNIAVVRSIDMLKYRCRQTIVRSTGTSFIIVRAFSIYYYYYERSFFTIVSCRINYDSSRSINCQYTSETIEYYISSERTTSRTCQRIRFAINLSELRNSTYFIQVRDIAAFYDQIKSYTSVGTRPLCDRHQISKRSYLID